MKKRFIEGFADGILNGFYAMIDGTFAWLFLNKAFDAKITWEQSVIVCLLVINLIRSGTRRDHTK